MGSRAFQKHDSLIERTNMTHKAITHKSKAAAVLLTLCFGAFGVHRFYLGNTALGILYIFATLMFFVLFPPALLAITVLLCLEAVYFLCRGKAYYQRRVVMEVVG